MISMLPERLIASARTSDHHPMPIQATRSGSKPIIVDLFPACPNCRHRSLRNAQIGLPIAPAHADCADALAIQQNRHASLHCGPAVRPCSERQPDRMHHVEMLARCTLCGRRSLVGSGTYRLGAAGMQRMETAAVHPLEYNDMSASIRDAARDRNASLTGALNGGRHHLACACMRQAFCIG